MSWVAVGVTAAAVVGGVVQSNSAKKASGAQGRAQEQAMQQSELQNALSREDSQPWRSAGEASVGRMRELLGLAPSGRDIEIDQNDPRYREIYDRVFDRANKSHQAAYAGQDITVSSGSSDYARQIGQIEEEARDTFAKKYGSPTGTSASGGAPGAFGKFTEADFWSDPVTKLGFDFGLSEGTKGINRMAAAGGMRDSGSTLKALTRFGTDYTGTKAGESYNRFYGDQDRTYNRLAGMAGTGQTAQANTSALGAQNSMNMGNMITAGGNARGAAAIAQGNAYGGAFQNIGNWWNQQQMLKQLQGNQSPSYGAGSSVNWNTTGDWSQASQAVG